MVLGIGGGEGTWRISRQGPDASASGHELLVVHTDSRPGGKGG
jgi:hypothetical protein